MFVRQQLDTKVSLYLQIRVIFVPLLLVVLFGDALPETYTCTIGTSTSEGLGFDPAHSPLSSIDIQT